MAHAGVTGLDTPRTNLGDATYLTSQPLDFDISQEQSFQPPSKDSNNLVQQLQNGRRGAVNLKTPRSRVVLNDRRNLPAALAGGEFTPLLKSATRNSALRNGKENVVQTPAFLKPGGLDNIPEDFSPLPQMGSSIYGRDSRNASYMAGTPMSHIDSSSTASTPLALLPRRNEGPGILQDGNQLSLREQENVIDKIEKENFGLKLKIHFLEDALRKAGPGFSDAALKENTELKVDKVTMQGELHRYKKTLTTAEHDVELYRQQILEMQEKVKRKHADESQREELDRLHLALDEKEAELEELKSKGTAINDLEDKVHDLETELREKDRVINDNEDDVDNLKNEVNKHLATISDLEESVKHAQRREVELEEKIQSSEDLVEAKEIIEELEQDLERMKEELEEAKEDRQEAIREKKRAQDDLEELQDEMANKSVTTKGLSRQTEEKVNRLQDDLEDLREKHSALEEQYEDKIRHVKKLEDKFENLKQDGEVGEQRLKDKLDILENEKQIISRERAELSTKLDTLQRDLEQMSDEKNLLQIRHDALTGESADLQNELAKSHKSIRDLEGKLDHEKTLALTNEREVRDEYKSEIDRLSDQIEDLRADIREKERLYDDDSDKWEAERRDLELQKDRAEEEATGLQRTIDRLQEAEGSLSGKETKLQQALESERERHETNEAMLNRQNTELKEELQSSRKVLEEVRSELSAVREELRLSQREQRSLLEKVEGLEDEVEVLQTSLEEESLRANMELSAAKQESAGLRSQLQTFEQAITNEESDQVNSSLKNIEAQLFKVRQEKQSLQNQLAMLNTEIHSTRASKTEAEAAREELQIQLQELKQANEDTFRRNIERVDYRGSPNMKELAESRRTIMELTERVYDLEDQVKSGGSPADAASEISFIHRDLSAARQKELEYLQREAAQKDMVRTLKRQIAELERKYHDVEVSQLAASPPHLSSSGSGSRPEILEVQHQPVTTHQSLRDVRTQLKVAERDASQKLKAANVELQAKTEAWELEKDQLERSLDKAHLKKDELAAKNNASEATISRLRGKIDRLEKALQAERLSGGEDRTMALERRDLHEMLLETQLQAESLEVIIKKHEGTIAAIAATELDLRAQLKRVRDDRALQRSRATVVQEELGNQERRFRKAQESWDAEKKALTRGVRFTNMSLSMNDESVVQVLRLDADEREKRHLKELRGLSMQVEWLRARCKREEGLRAAAAYVKRYMGLQIDLYQAWYVSWLPVYSYLIPSRPLRARAND
jgi:predicted  nucleic acid-binding Zn-ribbon protein